MAQFGPKKLQSVNTSTSKRLLSDKKMKPLSYENALNFIHEFLYDNFNKNIEISFLVTHVFHDALRG